MRPELTRLFYWAASQRKTVSALRRADYDAYEAFLRDPQPAAIWCGPKRPRASPEWRPFVAGLTNTSVRNALAIVQSMLSFWVQDGYLESTGHADERTLRKYNQRLLKDRHRDVAKVFDAPNEPPVSAETSIPPKRPSQLDML